MSPEQISGDRELTQACDQYAFGVTVFFMATGRVPFEQTTELGLEVLQAHMSADPPSPAQWNPRIPNYLQEAILRALEKDPEDRFQSCFHMKRFLESQGTSGAS